MKKGLLFSVITLVLSLTCAIACFAGCNLEFEYDPNYSASTDGDSSSGGGSTQHTHEYQFVNAVTSTCTVQGTAAHYVCTGCDALFVLADGAFVPTTADALKLELAAHTYVDHAEVPATCISTGTKAYSTCSVCEKLFVTEGGVKTETTASALVLDKLSHTFTGIEITTKPKLVYEEGNALDTDGMVVTKLCSTDGCSGVTATADEITIVYGPDQTSLKKGQESVTVKVGEFTATLDGLTVTAPKQNVALPEIHSKTYTGETLTADVEESEYYEVTKNEGGVNVGTYYVELTIKEDMQAEWAFNGSSTKTLTFEITKADNTFSGLTATATITCKDIKDRDDSKNLLKGVTTASRSDVYIVLADGNNTDILGDTIIFGEPYTVKAYALATENYKEASSEEFTLTFTHELDHYVQSADDATKDLGYCSCNDETPLEGYVYNKVVTANNDLALKAGASFTLSLAGIEYDTLKSFTYGEISYVSDEPTTAMPTVSVQEAWLNAETDKYGVKNFTAVVTKDGFDHEINVPVTFVTDIVTDWATFLHTFQSHTGNYEQGFFGEGEYYILGCDIEAGSADSHTYEGTTYKKYTTNPNDANDSYYWHGDAETVYYGFAGVLDGRGYAITNISAGYGIFGVMKGGTIKNIDFTVKEWTDHSTGTSLLGPMFNVTIENVNIIFNKVIDMPLDNENKGHGVIIGQQGTGNTFKNINVYASGSVLDCLVMQGGTVASNTFENVNFYAKSFERFASGVNKDTWAANSKYNKVTFTEVAAFDVPSIFVQKTDSVVDFTKPAAFSEYALKALRYGSASVMTSDGMLDVTKFAAAVGAKAGTYTLFITLKKDGHEVKLPMSVSLISEIITTWEQLLYRVQYRSGVDSAFNQGEYYVLGNDIVGGSTKGATYNGNTWNGSCTYESNGFAGTLDGLGHKVTGIQFSGTSLFGAISGGTVKNITFEGEFGEGDQGLLGGDGNITSATLENVTFILKPETKEDGSDPYTDFTGLGDWGLLSRAQVFSSTFTNFVVHAEGFKFKNLTSNGVYGAVLNTYNDGRKNYYYNSAMYVADYCYIGQTITYNYSDGNFKVYTDVQNIELSDETVSIALPTVMTNGSYYAYIVMLNGTQITAPVLSGVKQETHGGVLYSAIDMANISVADIKAAIGDNYDKEYEINICYSTGTLGYTQENMIVLRAKFTQPASTEAAE